MLFTNAEIAAMAAPLLAFGASVIFYNAKWYCRKKRARREKREANRIALREADEKRSEYKRRVFLFETWGEVNSRRRKTVNCTVKGCMAEKMDGLSKAQQAAVYSGRYAKTERIRRIA